MRILIAGSGRLGISVMEPLLDSGHEIVGILQNGKRYSSMQRRAQQLRAHVFGSELTPMRLAAECRIPVEWITDQSESELMEIRMLKPDLLISCGFSIIFSDALLQIPRIGSVNVHSSLLPKHRGASPFAHVILQNESESGVTFHITESKIDTGPILAQQAYPITERDTGMTVYFKACDTARHMVCDVVDRIAAQGIDGTPQDESQASYDPRFTEDTARIDWNRPATEIHRLIRAAVAYYPAWFEHHGRIVRVTKAHTQPGHPTAEPGTVVSLRPHPIIATGDGCLALEMSYTTTPLTNKWPSSLTRLRPGALVG